MDWILIILACAVGLLAVAVFLRKGNDKSGNEDLRREYASQAEEMRREYASQLEKMQTMHRTEMEAREKFFAEQRRADEEARQREIDAVNAKAESRFKELTALMMQQTGRDLTRTNKEQLDAILTPLQSRLAEFRKAVEEASVEDKASRQAFRDRIEDLIKMNASLGKEAENLASALRGQNKIQGDWGEMVLCTLLEQSGLSRGIHFDEQVTTDGNGITLRNESGRGLRPDVVVNLPDSRKMVIDSKVTLNAWLDVCSAQDEAIRKEASVRLLKSVKKHIDELAAKRYQDYIGSTPDFVVMFIPIEGAFISALQSETDLWNYAWQRNVALTSPTHLYAIIHLVTNLWQNDMRNNNALKIAEKAGSVYDKILLFLDSLDSLGKSLENADNAYKTAMSRLATGKGNILKATEELKELGVKGKSKRIVPERIARFGERDLSADKLGSLEE